MSKVYTDQVLLRHPDTKKVKYGTIQFTSDGDFMDFHELLDKVTLEKNRAAFNKGHTLIGMNIVSVKENVNVE